MRINRKIVFTGATLTMGIIACILAQPFARVSAEEKPAILVNITSGMDDLHAVSMGLGLAQTSLKHGHEVLVFLNVHAPVFATSSLGEDVKIADFPPVKEMIATVINSGGRIMVCGHCSSVCGVSKEDLIPSVSVSEHGDVLDALKPGMVGFSY